MRGRKKSLEREARDVFRPGRHLRRSVYLIPSLFTVANMFAGFFSVVSTLNGDYEAAAVAIGIAVLLDGVDGWVARLANADSDFGLQLDSLADVISFGIAPAILIYSWGLSEFGDFARFSAFVFLICGAMRLARFNAQVQDLKSFAGLPIPAGASFVAATIHFFGDPPASNMLKLYLVGATYLVALLMISTIRYPSFKQLNLGRGKSHLFVLMLALVVAAGILYSRPAFMVLASIYLGSGLVIRALHFFRNRSARSDRLQRQEVQSD